MAGIRKAFYVIEQNDLCPAIMEYITEAHNGLWSTVHNGTKFSGSDLLTVSLLVQHNDDVHIGTTECTVSETDGNSKFNCAVVPANEVNLLEECTARPIECIPARSETSNGIASCVGDELFKEEFSSVEKLDTVRWTPDIRLETYTEFVHFNDDANNVYVKNGLLTIRPTITTRDVRRGNISLGDRCTASSSFDSVCELFAERPNRILPPVQSALISTRNSFSFRYGRIEIEAQLPRGNWIFPYITLRAMSDVQHQPQMRVAFARGNREHIDRGVDVGGNNLYGGTIWKMANVNHQHLKSVTHDEHFGNDFHVYSLSWKEQEISLAVDGITYGTITEDLAHFNQMFHLALGVSAGGHTEFPDNSNKPWNNTSPKAMLNFWKKRMSLSWDDTAALKVASVRVFAV